MSRGADEPRAAHFLVAFDRAVGRELAGDLVPYGRDILRAGPAVHAVTADPAPSARPTPKTRDELGGCTGKAGRRPYAT